METTLESTDRETGKMRHKHTIRLNFEEGEILTHGTTQLPTGKSVLSHSYKVLTVVKFSSKRPDSRQGLR